MVNRRKHILETPKRRQRRRRRLIIKLIILFIFLSIVVGVSIYFFRTSYLRVSEVQVFGTTEINPETLKEKAQELSSGSLFFVLPRNQVLLYPRKQIEDQFRHDFKQISSVSVKLVGPTKVAINVQERTPFALYCINTCFFTDQSGYVYKESGEVATTTGYITFRDTRPEYASSSPLGTYPLNEVTFKKLESFARNMETLKLNLEEVVMGVNNDVYMLTKQGKVIISIVNPLEQQFDLLKIALSQSPFLGSDGSIKSFGRIDVRFGNKIFYTPGTSQIKKATSTATSTI